MATNIELSIYIHCTSKYFSNLCQYMARYDNKYLPSQYIFIAQAGCPKYKYI